MTQLVIPGMEKRRRGAIVNIGSAASTLLPAGPLLSVYAGTKVGALAAEAVVPPQSDLSCLLHIHTRTCPFTEGAGRSFCNCLACSNGAVLRPLFVALLLISVLSDSLACEPGQTPALGKPFSTALT